MLVGLGGRRGPEGQEMQEGPEGLSPSSALCSPQSISCDGSSQSLMANWPDLPDGFPHNAWHCSLSAGGRSSLFQHKHMDIDRVCVWGGGACVYAVLCLCVHPSIVASQAVCATVNMTVAAPKCQLPGSKGGGANTLM